MAASGEEDGELSAYHSRTRERGVNRAIYWAVRAVLQPFFHLYFRLTRMGHHHIPDEGPVILAANHRSFLDPFVLGCCLPRPVYFVAKRELFEGRLVGWLLNALGAFPIRRGESDEEAMQTARMVLERGEPVVIFPEGTRVRAGALGQPRRGVGRLALQTAAPVVPVAVIGSERARSGWKVRPVRVRIRCGRPLTFPRAESPSPKLAAEVAARIWPCVELQWEWLGGLPALRKAAVVGAGPMGTAIAALLERAGLEVQLGCRNRAQAERIATAGANDARLPGVSLPPAVEPRAVGDIEFAGVDLVVFAVASRHLPAAVGEVGARVGQRSAVLVLSKGLVGPLGTRPSLYVGERVRARAVASLGGPAHAAEAVTRGASVVLAAGDGSFRDQLGAVLSAAGLRVEQTDDVPGTELAGCAKNVAALAAAAAAPHGMNAAGAVAGEVFLEVHRLAVRSGARSETFLGLAGTGDLVATALAPGSRNRRAGELLGRGVPAAQVAGMVGGTAEALETIPLLAEAMQRAETPAPAIAGLAAVLDGRQSPSQWLEAAGAAAPRAVRAA